MKVFTDTVIYPNVQFSLRSNDLQTIQFKDGVHPRLLNQLLENPNFKVDETSLPYIVRDIINMNWWNTCDFLIGYQNNRRVFNPIGPSKEQEAIAITLKEYYRENQLLMRDDKKLRAEIELYISGQKPLVKNSCRQLKLFSMTARRNDSQYYRKTDGSVTWLDCTSRAKYAFSYLGANAYFDFDGSLRIIDAEKVHKLIALGKVHDIGAKIVSGTNSCKAEVFSQNKVQANVAGWVEYLGIKIIPDRQSLYETIKFVCTDPYKRFEQTVINKGIALGVNECMYGLVVGSASHASNASRASRASDASGASRASRASDASHASRASDAGVPPFVPKSKNWFDEPKAYGPIPGLLHPLEFRANKFGLAGHWKINYDLVRQAKKGWFDPFMGHGESPLFAARIGLKYLGQDINSASINGYLQHVLEFTKPHGAEFRVWDSTVFDPNLVGQFDLCYTSPPYFDFEEYCEENMRQVRALKDYDDFHEKVTKPVFTHVREYLTSDGILAIQTEKDKKLKEKWKAVILSLGYQLVNDTEHGEVSTYSKFSKRGQNLLIFSKLKD